LVLDGFDLEEGVYLEEVDLEEIVLDVEVGVDLEEVDLEEIVLDVEEGVDFKDGIDLEVDFDDSTFFLHEATIVVGPDLTISISPVLEIIIGGLSKD
jgi:hypothetical protein